VLVLALLGVAMDIENSNGVSDSDDGDDVGENIDELCAVTQAVINNNVALLNHLCFIRRSRLLTMLSYANYFVISYVYIVKHIYTC
jgi:hypothetical protein